MAEASSLISTKIHKNYLECSICTGPFDDPRALPCLHPFCCGCLENWTKACSKDGKEVSCPLCKKAYQVPEEGIKGFPAHFLAADLQSTVDKTKQKDSTSDDLCESHGEKKIYYCKNCDCAVCSDCSALDPTHRGHSFIRLKQAALQQSRSLGDLTRRVREVETKFVTAVQQAHLVKQDLEESIEVKIKALDEARNEHVRQLDNLVAECKREVYSRGDEQTKAINPMIEKLQSDLAIFTSSCELATSMAESGSDSDIISLY